MYTIKVTLILKLKLIETINVHENRRLSDKIIF